MSVRTPSWDLLLVLNFMKSEAFEPLYTMSLRQITKKTLFLLSLATAKRVGELQAVSKIVSYSGKDVYLSYLPEFIAKTESETNPLPRSVVVKALNDYVGSPAKEELLFMSSEGITDISIMNRTIKALSTFFVPPSKTCRSLTINAISFFLKETIREAYAQGENSGPSVP